MRTLVVVATVLTIGLPLAPSPTSAEIPTSADVPTSVEIPISVETPPAAEILTGSGDDDDTIFDSPVSDVIDGGNGSDTIDPEVAGDTITGPVQDDDLAEGVSEDVISTAVDRTGPSITDVSMPAWIRAGETLTVTWRVADSNGVIYTYLSIGGASGWITSWCGFAVNGELTSGTMFDGTYRLECELPSNAVNGTYTLFFSAFDSSSNVSPWDRSTQFDFEVTDGSSGIDPVPISGVTSEITSETLSETMSGGELIVRCRVRELTPSGELGVCGLPAIYSHPSRGSGSECLQELPLLKE